VSSPGEQEITHPYWSPKFCWSLALLHFWILSTVSDPKLVSPLLQRELFLHQGVWSVVTLSAGTLLFRITGYLDFVYRPEF
jgi:hypothetical protein